MKKVFSCFLIIACFLCSIPVSAATIVPPIDRYLINAGLPETMVLSMSEEQKEMIYETSYGESFVSVGVSIQQFEVLDDGQMALVQAGPVVSPNAGGLDPADLTLSVYGMKTYVPTTGEYRYRVYPSFVWHTIGKTDYDSLTTTMFTQDWLVAGDSSTINIVLRNHLTGGVTSQKTLAPTDANATGYTFTIPGEAGMMDGLYEGYASYRLEKLSETAIPRIKVHYVHDDTQGVLGMNYSISIGIGGVITVTPYSDKVREMVAVFNLSEFN